MPQEHYQGPSIPRPTRLVKYTTPSRQDNLSLPVTLSHNMNGIHPSPSVSVQEQVSSTANDLQRKHLMELSGMMRAIRLPRYTISQPVKNENPALVEEYWPHGIRQTGPLPIVNLYGEEPFGRSLPRVPVAVPATPPIASPQPTWKVLLNTPAVRITFGLFVGLGLLYLVSRFVDIPITLQVLRQNLTTPQGIILALLSGMAFLAAFCVRGIRWKLFLNPIGTVKTSKVIQLFLVGIFLNFLLPIRGGEVAKSIMLKRIANIPVSKSLPTVAMDKALDLMPALFIMAIVPFLGIKMDIRLWFILDSVGGLLLFLIFFIALAAWKRAIAITMLQKTIGILPKKIGNKIAGFATGFVDALLMGASRPKIFVSAILLTAVAVILDGLFAMLAFWTIGFPIPFGTAIFGYTVYNMFYILPTPPGQVGSNEFAGLLVFAGLLGLPPEKVTAMFVFSHPWTALLMAAIGMACLSTLGLTISSAMKLQTEGDKLTTVAELKLAT